MNVGLVPALERAGFSLATGAAAPKMNMVVLDGELAGIDLGPRNLVQARVLHVDDLAAIQANQMMVLMDVRVKTSHGTRVACFSQEAEGDKCSQDPMHRHAGDLRQIGADRPVNLLGRWMILPAQNRFKHRAPLDGNGQAALAKGRSEPI